MTAVKHKATPTAVMKIHSGKDKRLQNQTFNIDIKIDASRIKNVIFECGLITL